MASLTIPTCPEQVTAAWVTAALRASGFSLVTVTSVAVTPIGSVTSTMHRLHLAYSDHSEAYPATLIWKCSTLNPGVRGAFSGGYGREVTFYRDVAASVRARIPRCLLAEYDPVTGDHAILLEDMQHTHRSGALYEALSVEQAAPVMRELAAVHASQWDAEVLNPPQAETWQRFYTQEFEANREYFRQVVGEETLALLTPYRDRLAEWMPRLNEGPQSLVHWDTHPANVLFPRKPSERPVIIDWQGWRTGAPMRDVALFAVMGLDVSDRRAGERVLVEEYVSALRGYGFHYDPTRAFEDYRISAALLWGSAVNFTRHHALWDDELRAAMPIRIRRAAAALADMLSG